MPEDKKEDHKTGHHERFLGMERISKIPEFSSSLSMYQTFNRVKYGFKQLAV
jgi:hypothetical protein